MLHVAVVEDEGIYREKIKGYIERYAQEHDLQVMTSVYEDGSQIVEQYTKGFDILLLDIMMNGMDGMEAAGKIREVDDTVVLMFITQMAQYAINGYSVGALDYVLKPIDYESFSLRFARAVDRALNRSGGTVMLSTSSGVVMLRTRDIYYVEIRDHILYYHTVNGEYTVRGTMQGAERVLAPYSFVRSNHWYLVNLAHVSEIDKNIVVVGEFRLEISRRNRTDFMKAVADYMGGNS